MGSLYPDQVVKSRPTRHVNTFMGELTQRSSHLISKIARGSGNPG